MGDKFLGTSIILFILVFLLVAFGLFIKRFIDNKEKLKKINDTDSELLKNEFETKLLKKKEEEQIRLQSGDVTLLLEIIDRVFKSSKIAGLVKDKDFKLLELSTLFFNIKLHPMEDLVSTTKEITLKNGDVYRQNKHLITVKKEYAEKVFLSSYKVLEEVFSNIPTINNISINTYLEEDSNYKCVLTVTCDRASFENSKSKNNYNEKLDLMLTDYKYDFKEHIFEEVSLIEFDSTIPNKVQRKDNINLKKDNITIKDDSFSKLVEQFLASKNIKNYLIDNSKDNLSLLLCNEPEKIIVAVSDDSSVIHEEDLKFVYHRLIKDEFEKVIFLSNGSYSLDSVTYASVNKMDIIDKSKLEKMFDF